MGSRNEAVVLPVGKNDEDEQHDDEQHGGVRRNELAHDVVTQALLEVGSREGHRAERNTAGSAEQEKRGLHEQALAAGRSF